MVRVRGPAATALQTRDAISTVMSVRVMSACCVEVSGKNGS